jgi:O-succinylbenzoic acid--CoA ligase
VLLGGAAAPADLLSRAREVGVRVVTTYGMSETSGGCVYDGVPLAGVDVEAPDGRVRISGPVVALGYRLRPDLTALAFADGAFRTDDLGEVGPDGRLVVLGRADDVIVTGGEKVAPAAVEAVLASHPRSLRWPWSAFLTPSGGPAWWPSWCCARVTPSRWRRQRARGR